MLAPPLTGDSALRALESGPRSFKSQPYCLRAGALGEQVSSSLCASVSPLKQGVLCEDNIDYQKIPAWRLARGNYSIKSSYYYRCHCHHYRCPASPAVIPNTAGSVPAQFKVCAPQAQVSCHKACGASCPTGRVPPLREGTINRLPGHRAWPYSAFIHSQIFPGPQEPGEHRWQGGPPCWKPSPISSSRHRRPPEPQPAFWPTQCPLAPTAAGPASFAVLAIGPTHRVTFRPLLSLFSFNQDHPSSTNSPTFYSKYYSRPQNAFMSFLQEAYLPPPAHAAFDLSFIGCRLYTSGLGVDLTSSGDTSLPRQGAPAVCPHGPTTTTNTLN